jgi:propanol-preferring alcohol dehydrogenase
VDGDKDHLTQLGYHDHLWLKKEIKSAADMTRRDIAEFLPIAAEMSLRPKV